MEEPLYPSIFENPRIYLFLHVKIQFSPHLPARISLVTLKYSVSHTNKLEQRETYSSGKLFFLGTAVVLSHFCVVIWHLLLLLKVQPDTPRVAFVLLIVVNLIPVAAMVVFQRGRPRLAGWMIVVPLGVALIIGIYAHFVSAGSDNVFHMQPGEWRLSFQVSAVLLAALEALGCLIGFRMFWPVSAKHR